MACLNSPRYIHDWKPSEETCFIKDNQLSLHKFKIFSGYKLSQHTQHKMNNKVCPCLLGCSKSFFDLCWEKSYTATEFKFQSKWPRAIWTFYFTVNFFWKQKTELKNKHIILYTTVSYTLDYLAKQNLQWKDMLW